MMTKFSIAFKVLVVVVLTLQVSARPVPSSPTVQLDPQVSSSELEPSVVTSRRPWRKTYRSRPISFSKLERKVRRDARKKYKPKSKLGHQAASSDATQSPTTVTPSTAEATSTPAVSVDPTHVTPRHRPRRRKVKPKIPTREFPAVHVSPPTEAGSSIKAPSLKTSTRNWWWTNDGKSFWIPPSSLPSLYLIPPSKSSPPPSESTTPTPSTMVTAVKVLREEERAESVALLLFLLASLVVVPYCTTLGRLLEIRPRRSMIGTVVVKLFSITGALVMVVIALDLEKEATEPKVKQILGTFAGKVWLLASVVALLFALLTPCRARFCSRIMVLSGLAGDISFGMAAFVELRWSLLSQLEPLLSFPLSSKNTLSLVLLYAIVNGIAYCYQWNRLWRERRNNGRGRRTHVQPSYEGQLGPAEVPPPVHVVHIQRSRSIPDFRMSSPQPEVHCYSARPAQSPLPS